MRSKDEHLHPAHPGDAGQQQRSKSKALREEIAWRLGAAREQTTPPGKKVGAEDSGELAAAALALAEEARQIAAAALQASAEQIETIKQLQGAIGRLEKSFEEMKQQLRRLPKSLENLGD